MSKEAMKLALEAAYLAGWNASGEGYNAEYPFGDHARNPEEDAVWVKDRDNAICQALANEALDKMAENARELGLDYEPAQQQEPVKREHITDDSSCWCEPETIYKDPETGVSVIVHKEPQ